MHEGVEFMICKTYFTKVVKNILSKTIGRWDRGKYRTQLFPLSNILKSYKDANIALYSLELKKKLWTSQPIYVTISCT